MTATVLSNAALEKKNEKWSHGDPSSLVVSVFLMTALVSSDLVALLLQTMLVSSYLVMSGINFKVFCLNRS